jgi:hypothetical protein
MIKHDANYFTKPCSEWQRRYEALRASFVERLPARVIAERFGYTAQYISLMRHLFVYGKMNFSEPVAEGKSSRYRVTSDIRQKIRNLRERKLAAGEIAELLSGDGIELSISTVERVLAEEGFPKLPRRYFLKTGITVKGTIVPDRSEPKKVEQFDGQTFESEAAGVFLFAPFLAKFDIQDMITSTALPGTKIIPALNYFLSFLSLKLVGNERYAHVGNHVFDEGLGLFSGLNVLPKCTALSTYSYSANEDNIVKLQSAFVKQGFRECLYDAKFANLDFHTIPHFGDESVLEKHWAGARGKRMKGALSLIAQDAGSKLMLYTAAGIKNSEANAQVFSFIDFWKKVQRRTMPTLVFDAKLTTYANLSRLNQDKIKFITLRRRGSGMVEDLKNILPKDWKRIHIPHAKRKYPNPIVHESTIALRNYEGELRQIIVRGNGREQPAFIITNDFNLPIELVVGDYARRWRVENGIAEAVKFFNLNSLSSPILIKVHMDIVMTMIADTLYSMFAQKLRGFEACDAPKIFQSFVHGKGIVSVKGRSIHISYPKKAHNPILRAVPWNKLPDTIPWLDNSKISFEFK